MNFLNSSVELYEYDDVIKANLGNSLSITDINGDVIEVTKEHLTNFKNFYTKGFFIIEGELTLDNAKNMGLINWQRDSSVNVCRDVNIKWYRANRVVREAQFKGRCLFYTENFDNRGHLHFEIVIQDAKYYNNDQKLVRYKDFYCLVELDKGSLKNVKPSNAFWSSAGIVLGGVAVYGAGAAAVTAGAITVGVGLTILYGVNTIVSCSYDLYMDYTDQDDKIGAFNILRDYVFKGGTNFIGNLMQVNEKGMKFTDNLGTIFYSGSEIILGFRGFKEVALNLKNFRAGSIYALFNPKKIKTVKDGFGAPVTAIKYQFNYPRFGYDVYQFTNGTKSMSGYTVDIYKAVTPSKPITATN